MAQWIAQTDSHVVGLFFAGSIFSCWCWEFIHTALYFLPLQSGSRELKVLQQRTTSVKSCFILFRISHFFFFFTLGIPEWNEWKEKMNFKQEQTVKGCAAVLFFCSVFCKLFRPLEGRTSPSVAACIRRSCLRNGWSLPKNAIKYR